MSSPFDGSDAEPTQPLGGQPPPPPPPPGYQQQPPPYSYQQAPYGAAPGAPWGVHPITGAPYSDKSKIVAGLLQILLPFGIGRFYIGDTTQGVAQLLVSLLTCGVGSLWSLVDGIVMLVGNPVDAQGRPLRG